MPLRLLLVLPFLGAGALLAQKEADARVEPGPRVPGGKVLEWTTPEGQPYWYRVPERVSESRPPALILMLHGTGMPYQWAFWNYPIATGRWRGDDVIVAPEGLTPGQGTTFNFVQGKKDGDQVANLIRLFKKKLPIGKVYVYGHSQGAFFAYWFAGEHPELVDGIVAHAGNVLDVTHSKLAKEKVGIGILHGKADAVVPVDCAYRTEKVYKDEGYRKVKLHVVEGLTAESGHWPLPVPVAEMLEWLDRVSADSAGQCLETALSELKKEAPDLAVVAEAAARGAELAKKLKGEEKAEAERRLALLAAFLETAQAAHAEALLGDPALADKKLPYGPWAARFRRTDGAFGGLESWAKALKAARAAAAGHDRLVDKALKDAGRPDKGTAAGVLKALEGGYLAARYDELETTASRIVEAPPKGTPEKALAALKALIDARRPDQDAAAKSVVELSGSLAARFREEHAELFPAAPAGG